MRRVREDRGDTLVEILVALAVLSIGITALIGALITNITTSELNQDQAQVSTILLSASEHVKGLPPLNCGAGTVTLDPADVPHDNAVFQVTYGPAVDFDGATPCSIMYRVPVTVTGAGFAVTVDVVKRP